jgi:hypothetical protein
MGPLTGKIKAIFTHFFRSIQDYFGFVKNFYDHFGGRLFSVYQARDLSA